jgi:ribosomal protein S18 acetylase RimI-like enzyme
MKNIEIKFVEKWKTEEIVSLYKSGGWWKEGYKDSSIPNLIQGSFAFAVVINKKTGKAVGMGRILSDGVSDAYIQDIVLQKNFRNKGIGKKLVSSLIKYCKNKNIFWIALIAEPNQDDFYKKIGFKEMKNYTPMKYEDK